MKTRNETISEIKSSLRLRSKEKWSVTGGKGTAWGWISITAIPSHRTWGSRPLPHNTNQIPGSENWEEYDTGKPNQNLSPYQIAELKYLLADCSVGRDGVSIPSSSDYYQEYTERAAGLPVTKLATPYWD